MILHLIELINQDQQLSESKNHKESEHFKTFKSS